MDKVYDYTKAAILNFKLDRCCCLAPIPIGLIVIGFCNIFIALLSLVNIADVGTSPPLMVVQELVLENNASKPLGVMAYATELGFNMVFLCGMYRYNDIDLLRIYTYFVVAGMVTAILLYSMVIAHTYLLTKLIIISNIGKIILIEKEILLIQSAIVEIKETTGVDKNGHAVLYSVSKIDDEPKVEIKIADMKTSSAVISGGVENRTEETKSDDEIKEKSETAKLEMDNLEPKVK
ncbi:uncharacterized protein LOC119833034 [Zerene cesonia]|uniref:uncharacterized protein LOC119833034 n=1 Tax=Zerene cesonia TaxID=33412 RepID=UPI0018E4FC16|nr:uncharacterized protein LOC119833034 [Zerene cesonia]